MATLKEVKTRIEGIRSTQKITKAMKIVAATKLRVHERAVSPAKTYSAHIRDLLENIVTHSYHPRHCLLSVPRSIKTRGILVIGSDRGLCSSFNANLFRNTLEFIEEQRYIRPVIATIGKKAYNFFKKTKHDIVFYETDFGKKDRPTFAQEVADKMLLHHREGRVKEWCVFSNRFTSRAKYGASHDVLIPITVAREAPRTESLFLFEDDLTMVLDYLLPLYIRTIMLQYIIESQTTEELSRMLAMDYATENAEELIGELTLFYNRTRQQVITKELSEIVGGAEALK